MTALVAIAAAVIGAGCGGGAEPPGDPSSAGELDSPVTLVRGGGIAGGTLEIVVEPSGAVAVSENGGEERRTQLSAAELERLARAVNATPFEQIGERTTERCADCFAYTVDYGGGSFTVDQAAEGGEADRAREVIAVMLAAAEAGGVAG